MGSGNLPFSTAKNRFTHDCLV